MTDVWDDVCRGTKVTLWCNGLKENKKGKKSAKSVNPNDSESSTEDELPIKSRKKNTEVRDKTVEKTIQKLRENHETVFTPMQYRHTFN